MVRTCRLANATEGRLRELIELNLTTLDEALDYIASLGLGLFRLSSDTIPFGSHPCNRLPWWRVYGRRLAALGAKASGLGLRLSMHPGQYTLLNAPSAKVHAAALADLVYHDRLLDSLGCPESSKIVIHLGGAYGDKTSSLKRFEQRYRALDAGLRSRLVLENDDRIWSTREALGTAERVGAPFVFDDFHHRCLPSDPPLPVAQALVRAARTWKKRDGCMKVHFSSQQSGARPGSHAELINEGELETLLEAGEGLLFDLMIEAKGKERAALIASAVVARRQAAPLL